ncbi:MAG TPA: hypothetical protein DIU00_18310 [Phycisphaerales bacterium]|nr:hypothetical protein [Phycisphaerales bacterium]
MKETCGKSRDKIFSLLFTTVLLSFYFIYLLLRINPKLIYQAQEPVFFIDRYFIYEFFSYPGGVNELLSGFLSQFFYYSWTGALLLVLVFAFVTLNTWLLVRSITTIRPIFYLHWIPSIILLTLHSNYRFPLVLTLGLLWALLCVNIYIRLVPSKTIPRLLLYLILQAVLYYVTAGQAFIFSLVIILYETVCHRRIALPLFYVLFASLVPYIGASTVFIIRIRDAYTMHLTSYDIYRVTWLSWLLYAFFPIVLLTAAFERRYIKAGNNLWSRLLYRRSVAIRLAGAAVIFALVAVSAFYSYDKKEKLFFLLDRYARFEEWDKVLDIAQKGLPISNVVQCQVNRALYHSGYLCDKMFGMTQLFGGDGIFLHESVRAPFALQHSDLFFDLGLINESEHWAHEAVAANGDTAWNLQRLALVNLAKQKPVIAAKYLKMLHRTMWHKQWAEEHQKYLSAGNDFFERPKFRYLKSVMPESDFLVSPTEPELCLEELIKNTNNKMAFEYFMAYCLLEGQIGRFARHLQRLNHFDYPKIPRHFEEAMLIYNQLTAGKGIALQGKTISEQTIRKFNDFNKIKAKYKNDKKAARKELEKYRDTYWFYGLYYYKPDE